MRTIAPNSTSHAWTGVLALVLLGPCVLVGTDPVPTVSGADLLRLVCLMESSGHAQGVVRVAQVCAGDPLPGERPDAGCEPVEADLLALSGLSDRTELIDLPPPVQGV